MYKPLEEENSVMDSQIIKDETQNLIEYQRIGDQILIDGTEINESGLENKPTITSLDNIPKYTNLFVCVHPFIFHGYRIHHSLKDCLCSLFTLHNESLNIWTHLVPFFSFIFLIIHNIVCNFIFYFRSFRICNA